MKTAISSGKDVPKEEKLDDDTKAWLIARIDHQLGINHTLTEETTAGIRSLKSALNFILKTPISIDTKDDKEKKLPGCQLREERLGIFGIQSIDCLNHLGVILSNLAQPKLALKYLRLARRVHGHCIEIVSDHAPAPPASAATESTEAMPPPQSEAEGVDSTAAKNAISVKRLRELHTYTLFYLAQVNVKRNTH